MTKAPQAPKKEVTKLATAQPSKKDRFHALLASEAGATIAEIVEATGWQAHSARAMLTGLRKQGLTVGKSKVEGVTRYRLHVEVAA